ncbi:MAG: SIMPL domain-containing protein [Saprospiraceae bacterium]|nr:SIMPL domain-containing protein [Saprospiraceae bacterium]
MKAQALLIAFLFATLSVNAQTQSENSASAPYIESTGTAELMVVPDQIFLRISLQERYLNRTKITVDAQETQLKAAILALGIPIEKLSLADAIADYVKIRRNQKDVLTRKDYQLLLPDAETLGNVLEALDKLEVADAYINSVSHSKLDSLQKTIRIKAIQAAKEKADYLLSAIGEQTGKPLIVKVINDVPYGADNDVNIKGSRTGGVNYYIDGVRVHKVGENDIQYQKIRISMSVYVKFGIK